MEKNHHNSFLITCNVCRPHLIGQIFQRPKIPFGQAGLRHQKNGHGAQYGWDEVESTSSCIDGYTYMYGIQLRLFELRFLALIHWWQYGSSLNFQDCRNPSLGRWCLQSSSQDRCHERTWVVTDPFHVVACKKIGDIFFEIPHASNCPSCFHPCNGVSNFWPAMCTPGFRAQYKENAAFAQPSPINLYIYIQIYLYINNIYIFSHHASYGVHPMHLQDPWHWLDASRSELD